jgi:hypothetical protein
MFLNSYTTIINCWNDYIYKKIVTMKQSLSALTILILFAFAGCTKQASNTTSSADRLNTGNKADLTTPGSTFSVADNGDGTFTATLQPDSSNGEDVHVYKREGSPDIANTNFNDVPELDITAWTVNGAPATLRVFLRFADLSKIPSTAKILSATLYLYGVSNSLVSPQGNSNYPGSPYNQYGSNRCIIESVTGPWEQSTLTWNTQPRVADTTNISIPHSTTQWNYNVVLNDVKAIAAKGIKYPDKNYGVRISMATETYYRNMVFSSSEASDPSLRPKLVVVYK